MPLAFVGGGCDRSKAYGADERRRGLELTPEESGKTERRMKEQVPPSWRRQERIS